MRLIDSCALQEEYKTRHSGKRLLLIDVAPTVDAVPVRRGRWLSDNRPGGGFWVCSSCKFPSEAFAANILYKFCPNCGADMRKRTVTTMRDDTISRQAAINAFDKMGEYL